MKLFRNGAVRMVVLFGLAALMTALLGCSGQAVRTPMATSSGDQAMGLAAGDALGKTVFGNGQAEILIAARRTADVNVASANTLKP